MTKYIEKHEVEYFGMKVRAFITASTHRYYKDFPWRFEIEYKGKLLSYIGIPNYLQTKKQALKRAWWRAKWLSEGSYNQKYS